MLDSLPPKKAKKLSQRVNTTFYTCLLQPKKTEKNYCVTRARLFFLLKGWVNKSTPVFELTGQNLRPTMLESLPPKKAESTSQQLYWFTPCKFWVWIKIYRVCHISGLLFSSPIVLFATALSTSPPLYLYCPVRSGVFWQLCVMVSLWCRACTFLLTLW